VKSKRLCTRYFQERVTDYATQGTQIKMLTADENILGPFTQISRAVVGNAQGLNAMIEIVHQMAKKPIEQQRSETPQSALAVFAHIDNHVRSLKQIDSARMYLINRTITRFSPATVGAVARINRSMPPPSPAAAGTPITREHTFRSSWKDKLDVSMEQRSSRA
jgi:hypothetical protein